MKNLLLFVLFLAFLGSKAQVVYVNHAATGANNGSSWTNAYTDLQVALTNTSTGQIWVAAGTYYPGPSGANNSTFTLKNNVQLYGGFNGTEIGLGQRDFTSNQTILSGDLDLSGDTTVLDAYHVVSTANTNSSAAIDGFVITGGYNTQTGFVAGSGGGIFVNPTTPSLTYNPIISNCVIKKNYAFMNGGGIAIYCWSVANAIVSPQITNCMFYDNSCSNAGGAIYVQALGANNNTNPFIENCLVYDNTSNGQGMHFHQELSAGGACNTTILGCTFANDLPGDDIIFFKNGNSGTLTMHNTLFYGLQIFSDATITGNNNNGTPAFLTGSSNINTDPLYLNPILKDFRLSCNSPCINQGNIAYPIASTSLGGMPRITAVAPDIGAYETNYFPPIVVANATLTTICSGDLVTLTGTGALTYFWDNGVIDGVPFSPVSTLTYQVTGTDAFGCVATNTITINVNPLPVVIPTATSNPVCSGNSTILSGSGTAISYNWTGGVLDGTPFNPLVTNTYTVTGTDIFGCIATNTITINVNPNPTVNLGSDFSICQTDSFQLTGTVAGGMPPYIFNWQNSIPVTISTANNEYYIPTYTDTYTLFVSDQYGCSGSGSFTITMDSSKHISGLVNAGAGLLTAGNVYLLKYSAQQQMFDTLISYSLTGTGIYDFNYIPYGSYLIKVVPDTLLFPTYLPTYYGDQFQWDSALIINHTCISNFNAPVNVIQLLGGSGVGSISGHIFEDFGYGTRLGNPSFMQAPGGPIKGIDIKLGKNPGGGVQARTTSDSTGFYDFTNLPSDSYRIYVDIPGLSMDSFYIVNIDLINTSFSNLDYKADSNSVYPLLNTNVSIRDFNATISKSSVFPNPSSDYCSVIFETSSTEKTSISISDISGKIMKEIFLNHLPAGRHEYRINFIESNLKSGIYFLRLQSGDKTINHKLVID